MDTHPSAKTFHLAPMSPSIRVITLVLLALPVSFFIAVWLGFRFHFAPGVLVIILYVWVWLRFRPSCFVVRECSLEVIWPMKYREIARESISGIRLLNPDELRQELGWSLRVGAGGPGGGFGWLWTKRHGLVQMYVSRTDRFVWIERKRDRPWLVTPEHPEQFVRTLSA